MGVEVNIRLNLPEDQAAHLSSVTGGLGNAESVGDYLLNLIRRDMKAGELTVPQWHEAEVKRAFATPSSEYVSVSAADVIKRNRRRRA